MFWGPPLCWIGVSSRKSQHIHQFWAQESTSFCYLDTEMYSAINHPNGAILGDWNHQKLRTRDKADQLYGKVKWFLLILALLMDLDSQFFPKTYDSNNKVLHICTYFDGAAILYIPLPAHPHACPPALPEARQHSLRLLNIVLVATELIFLISDYIVITWSNHCELAYEPKC